MEVQNNGFVGRSGKSQSDVLDNLTAFFTRNDISIPLPAADAKVTISSRNLQGDELDFKIKFNEASGVSESRKSKLKKIAIPILTFVLLKAITLVPLGLGILGIKAFNALQLSFFSFVISVALAVFQLCRKVRIMHYDQFAQQHYRNDFWSFTLLLRQISADHHHPQIAAAGPWDSRNFVNADVPETNAGAHDIVYNAY